MRIFYIFFIIILFTSCGRRKSQEQIQKVISCNAEHVKKNKFLSSDKNYLLNGADQRSDITSLSGNYSILTTKEKPYGFTLEINELVPDQYYHISVWCKGEYGYGILVADGVKNDFYEKQNKSVTDSNGWYKINLNFYLPPIIEFEKLLIYVWNNGGDSVFFDNLKVVISPTRTYPEFKEEPLQIFIDSIDIKNLRQIRLRAYNNGILETADDSYVKAKIVFGKDTLKGKIRFKGDYFNHLIGEKWSFRVKLKSKYSWKQMNTFSLHSPLARDFLDEKLLHDFCRQNDLLATRYGFVPVILNGKNIGIYAYEEHFRKELYESLDRREGIIVKFSEDELWFNYRLKYNSIISSNIPYFEASSIVPFQENKVASNKYLLDQFLIAQDLMYQFRYALKPASEIFDIDKLAKYMAIMDIMVGYHGIHWHNQRFYYNPVSMKLEPIAFDNYMGSVKIETLFIGKYIYEEEQCQISWKGLIGLFEDKIFVTKYLDYLNYYSQNFSNLIKPTLDEVMEFEPMIQKEFPYYKFEKFYEQRIEKIRRELDDYAIFIKDTLRDDQIKYKPDSENDYEYNYEIPGYLVKVYSEVNPSNGNIELTVVNYFNQAIELTGYILNDEQQIGLEKNISMAAFETYALTTEIKDLLKIKVLKFETNIDTIEEHKATVFPWKRPSDSISLKSIMNKGMAYLKSKGFVQGKNIIFSNGSHSLSQTVMIPEGYQVIFQSGAKLNLINHAAFITYSPVQMKGNSNSPVVVSSSDGTAMGFSIMQAQQKSILNHVVFDQLNTLSLKGWTLTGAVNIYDTRIELNNVSFINNRCEDALNIINSEFVMNRCVFDNIYADAFDSDFSKGELLNSEFRDIGNDAIDFSGSEVKIINCNILSTGDKGISAGENSNLYIENISVQNANVGLASKDNSMIQGKFVLIDKCNYGLIVFTKKSVYGPAKMNIDELDIRNTETMYLIEEKSELKLNGSTYEGTKKNLAKIFYL